MKEKPMPTRFIPTLVQTFPNIASPEQKGEYWFIEFEYPLDATQTSRVREICFGLQNIGAGILFAYEFLLSMPTEGKKASSRQLDRGGQVLRISRKKPSKCQGFKPYPLSRIAAQIVSRLKELTAE